MKFVSLVCVLSLFAHLPFAQQSVAQQSLISPGVIPGSENAVITDAGRYFVAAQLGVYEVSLSPGGTGSSCTEDVSGVYACLVLAPTINGEPCFMTGMTSNGAVLYGSCSAGADVTNPSAAAFFRMIPGEAVGTFESVEATEYPEPVWYNGMAVDSAGDVYMSASANKFPKASIVKLHIDNPATLSFTLTDWKININEFMPNGIHIENDTVYYVGGQAVYKIAINADGSAAFPSVIYRTGFDRLMDDLTITDDAIVVSEFSLLDALLGTTMGPSLLVFIDKNASWWQRPITQDTGSVVVSSLVEDKNGVLGGPGDLILTSFFQGGIYAY